MYAHTDPCTSAHTYISYLQTIPNLSRYVYTHTHTCTHACMHARTHKIYAQDMYIHKQDIYIHTKYVVYTYTQDMYVYMYTHTCMHAQRYLYTRIIYVYTGYVYTVIDIHTYIHKDNKICKYIRTCILNNRRLYRLNNTTHSSRCSLYSRWVLVKYCSDVLVMVQSLRWDISRLRWVQI